MLVGVGKRPETFAAASMSRRGALALGGFVLIMECQWSPHELGHGTAWRTCSYSGSPAIDAVAVAIRR